MTEAVDAGLELPSLYLECGGRLRCVAQRGYWQVYDGLPPDAGILGSTYSLGQMQVVRDPAGARNYIAAAPQVVVEICVPVDVDGRTVGVFNVESRRALSGDEIARVTGAAEAFAERLGELGGPEPERPPERLARLVYELACLEDRKSLIEAALEGAMALTGMSGAALCRDAQPTIARGGLGPVLAALPEKIIDRLAGCVALATSSYASGLSGDGFETGHVLRDRGARSVVVLALYSKGQHGGFLVLADREPQPGIASLVPLLELLAAALSNMLDTVGVNAELQRSRRELAYQAQHDSLTGVANRGLLLDLLQHELSDRDDSPGPVLLFIDLDGFKVVNDRHGHGAGDELLVAVADRLRTAARDSDLVARLGGDEFVLLCAGVSTIEDGVSLARRVLSRLAAPFVLHGLRTEVTACVGIAVAEPGTSADGLIAAGDRAMYAAKRVGAGTWSIAPRGAASG